VNELDGKEEEGSGVKVREGKGVQGGGVERSKLRWGIP